MNQLVVSVITPSYNSVKYLPEAYASLKAQTFSKWEWIVVDDFSVDESFELLQQYADCDERVRVHRNSRNLARLVQETLDLIWRRVNI